jgi:mannose-6-phosphate isomerase
MRFFDHPVAGAWWEHLDVAGDPIIEPTRASSLYHIMCAFRTMSGYVADRTTIEADDARSLV